MATRVSAILDHYGKPLQRSNGKPRPQLVEALQRTRQIRGTYDAARVSDETKNYWQHADAYDADSANSKGVREDLVRRSRYQIYNDGFSDGIASTWTTDLIGKGPVLRMQTGSENFNRMIENVWYYWTKAIQWRRKLWCLAHATHSDGEGIGVIRRNPRVNHTIKLDVRLYETEQCQTPYLPMESGYIDGIRFDEFGSPIWYDILQDHPGSSQWMNYSMTPERVPAKFVLHWYKLRRPGQHRGIPESTSTLNTGAAARRWREATLAAAETAADFAVMLETQYEPDELDAAEPFSTLNIQKRMMTALPNSMKASQLKAEHPTATYEAFHKTLINEQARPKSMPYNKAACDSSSYNYASGRLDHQTYYAALDVEREDCNDLVLDPLFYVWFEQAILTYGWLGGNPDAVSPAARAHLWDWPKHRVADVESEANANDTQLKNGTKSLAAIYTEAGEDYEDECEKMSAANGITVEQQKQINLLLNLPQHVLPVVTQILGLVPEPDPTELATPEPEGETENGDEE